MATGKLQGRLTRSRAELQAAITAVDSFADVTVFTDSQYVMSLFGKTKEDFNPADWANAMNGDFVLKFQKAFTSHGRLRM